MTVTINHRMVPMHTDKHSLSTSGSLHPDCSWSDTSPHHARCHSSEFSPSSAVETRETPASHAQTCPASVNDLHHSSTRFFRMISRTSDVTAWRTLSMGSSVLQKRTTFPSGFTRNFQKFHFGIFWTESETQHKTRHTLKFKIIGAGVQLSAFTDICTVLMYKLKVLLLSSNIPTLSSLVLPVPNIWLTSVTLWIFIPFLTLHVHIWWLWTSIFLIN